MRNIKLAGKRRGSRTKVAGNEKLKIKYSVVYNLIKYLLGLIEPFFKIHGLTVNAQFSNAIKFLAMLFLYVSFPCKIATEIIKNRFLFAFF